MSPNKLRLLAECMERDFITSEDRHGWVNDLRGFAKDIERSAISAQSGVTDVGGDQPTA
jgi:hypothetical protein